MAREYLIDRLIPKREVSLIYGPPGAGKTRFFFQWARHIHTGTPIVILDQHGVEHTFHVEQTNVAYIAFDRSHDAIEALLHSFDLDNLIQWCSLRDIHNPEVSNDSHSITRLHSRFPDCGCLLIDGMGAALTGKSNDYRSTANYMRFCGTIAKDQDYTMLGIMHSPKAREGQDIRNPRQRAIGSTAIAGMSECMIDFDHLTPEDQDDPRRRAIIMPHDAPSITAYLKFDAEGKLIPHHEPEALTDFDIWFISLPNEFTTKLAIDIGKQRFHSERTIQQWLEDAVDNGMIVRIERGKYKKRPVN